MADQPPRPMLMDPPHITEFGSEAFHEKLNQHSTQQEHGQQQPTPDSLDTAPAGPSRFIVPIRESRTVEAEVVKPSHQKRDKGRLRTLRSKVSFLHSKTSYVEVTALPPLPAEPLNVSISEPRRPSAVSTRSTLPFDQHFLSLPNELQIQIISSLPLSDVLNLRLASKSWHELISLNEAPIVRYHLDNHIPAYAKRLYPASDPSKLNFHHLCGLWHRLHVAAKLSFLMCEWITKDIFLRQTESQRLLFAPQHERMRRRLIPLLFTIFHFFETYRKLHLEHIAEHGGHGLQREPYTLNPIEAKIMSMYDDKTLLRVHEVFPLVISSFCRRLRPPTYVGRVERSLRGYIREKPSDEMHAAILTIGGLREVERLWEIKGYNNRRGAVDTWYYSLMKEQPPPETNTKSRRGFFGRKKQAGGDPIRFGDGQSRRPSAGNDITMGYDNLVFNTSLAAGAPMSSLDQQQVQALLGDLPVLQQIWSYTAEALILERRIVDRPQDIMRNQQVMLNLIREDGMDEEDEWWYGRGIPDSVRPPAAGITDDDAD